MINSPADPISTDSDLSEKDAIDGIVRAGPGGAIVLAGLATGIVVALWFAFYFLVFLPRGSSL